MHWGRYHLLRVALCFLLATASDRPGWAKEPDADAQAKSVRALEKKAKALEAAVAKLVAKCRRCGGDGRLLRRGQRVRCGDCNGTGRKVSRTFYDKVFWKMRSNRYRKSCGKGPRERTADYEAMQIHARPLRAGPFHSVESLDPTHAVSWHGTKGDGFVYYRWILDGEAWALYTPDYDGSWPDSNIDLGYPGAKLADKINISYDKFKDTTQAIVDPFAVGSELLFTASFSYKGMGPGGKPGDVLLVFFSESREWRFLKKHQQKVHILVNGVAVPLGTVAHTGDVVSGGVKENLGARIKREHLVQLIGAGSVEGRIGLSAPFRFTPLQLRILGELLRRYDAVLAADG